jgi:hypothetical protein
LAGARLWAEALKKSFAFAAGEAHGARMTLAMQLLPYLLTALVLAYAASRILY